MRRIAWYFLLLFVFTIPWEYSLDFGGKFGHSARIAGVLALLVSIPAVLQAGRFRKPNAFCRLTLILLLWFCFSIFWTIDAVATFEKIRGFFQEMMIVWLVWEFTDTPTGLLALLRAAVAGSWVLALLTLATFRSPEAYTAGQVRFAAYGQDPNDMARFLDLAFPFAALLAACERNRFAHWLALGFFPVGLVAVLLTASREGLLAAVAALAGCLALLVRSYRSRSLGVVFAAPLFLSALWFIIPQGVLARLATIPAQLQSGDLNERTNIWFAGWQAFRQAPLLGSGAGTFVSAAHLAPIDTAHNTVISIAVTGGLCALLVALFLVALAIRDAFQTHGPLRIALATSLLVWLLTTLAATVEENRITWLLLAIVVVAGRLAKEDPLNVAVHFAPKSRKPVDGQSSAFGARLES